MLNLLLVLYFMANGNKRTRWELLELGVLVSSTHQSILQEKFCCSFFYRAKISSCTAIHKSCRHSSIYGHYTLQVCVLRLGDFATASTNIVLHKYLNFRANSVSGGHISVGHCPG